MSSIEHVSTAKVTLNSEECEALNSISADKSGEMGGKVLASGQAECKLHALYLYTVGHPGASRYGITCDMELLMTGNGVDEQALLFKCAKALCRGEDAPTKAAEEVQYRVEEAVQAVQALQEL